MKTIFDEMKQEVKNWWISLILGILYIVVALCLMFAPLSGYAILSVLFSISMLFSGLLEISFAVSNRQRISSWGWYLVLFCRLCYGFKKIWNQRLGMVYRIRYPCHHLFIHYPVATGSRRYLCSLYDFVCFPDYRFLPHHALL